MSRIGPSSYPDEELLDTGQAAETPPTNPLLKIHQLLRGRYVWAVLTGVILAIGAAFSVPKLPMLQPKYTSTGTIQIRPALDPLIYPTEFNTRRADYELFLESQVNLLRDQRTIMHAMDLTRDQLRKMDGEDRDRSQRSNNWVDKTWPEIASRWRTNDLTEQVLRLTQGLGVSHAGGTQFLVVTFSDQDPILAAGAVKLIIASYRDLYDVDVENFNNRLARLGEKERILTSSVSDMKIFIQGLVGKYGSAEFLTQSLEQKQTDMLLMDEQYAGAEIQVKSMAVNALRRSQGLLEAERYREADAALNPVLSIWAELWPEDDPRHNEAKQLSSKINEKIAPGGVPNVPASQPSIEITPELAAATDEVMAGYMKNMAEAKRRLNFAQAKYGELSEPVRNAKLEVEVDQKDIDQRLTVLKSQMSLAGGSTLPATGTEAGRLTLSEANDRLKILGDRRDSLGAAVAKIRDLFLQVQAKVASLQRSQRELDDVQSARSKLQFEGVAGGRTQVINPGDNPMRPDKDRRMSAAVGGGLGGLALGFGIFALIGFFDRRVRSIADARERLDGSQRILGILPALPDDLADPVQVSGVAFAVHHIRTLLQLSGGEMRSHTFAITSAAPQDGKTSLTMALGMSYAASGAKTLLIDGDVIGAGLSSRMGAIVRPRLGQLLVSKGLLTEDQLEEALAESQQTGHRIGKVLVKLGFVQPQDRQSALNEQAAGSRGFLDMMDGQPLADCTSSAGIPNLSVMPIGNLGINHVGQISVDAVRRIIAEARAHFDIVLFDTGPLLGSLEAGIVAASVDDVIVAVARGTQVPLLDQTFRRLRELGARIAGIVFNRAQAGDIERSGYASSLASQRIPTSPPVVVKGKVGAQNGEKRLGPIANALAAASQDEEDH